MKRLTEVKTKKIINRQEVDLVVKDFYGKEHILFPKEEKEIVVGIKEGRKNGTNYHRN
jgi:hypothetical protein